MKFPHGQTITVKRPAKRSATGDPTAPASDHVVEGCAIAWGSGSADTDRRETAVNTVTLYCPDGADIEFGDRILLPGTDTVYALEGQPERWHSPWTGWNPGVVVTLKGVK